MASAIVVEDDPAIAALIVEIIRREGRAAEAIIPTLQLVAELLEANPSLLILDLSLGCIDALTVLSGLADRKFRGAVVLVSGHSLEVVTRVLDFGAGRGLHMLPPMLKPIDRANLRSILAAVPEPSRTELIQPTVDLAEALGQRWLEVWYQPQVNVGRRLLRSVEALVHVRRPGQPPVLVEEQVRVAPAEVQRRIVQMVVDTVARDMLLLSMNGWALPIAFNAPLSFIRQPAFVDMLCGVWPDSFARDRLIIEMRETDILADVDQAVETATRLKLYNVDLALDGFGAGFTSFTTVRNVPFSEIKLDPSVVSGAASSEVKRSLCAAVARLADSLGIPTVAAGVSNAADMKAVHAAGAGIAQGDYFGRPLPMGEFNRVLEAQRASGVNRNRGSKGKKPPLGTKSLKKAAW